VTFIFKSQPLKLELKLSPAFSCFDDFNFALAPSAKFEAPAETSFLSTVLTFEA